MNDITVPTETDILRFCIALGRARNDEDQVKQVIDEELAKYSPGLHATYLKVTLRVVTAQFLAPAARKLDRELGFPFVDAGLDLQEATNEGLLDVDEGALERPTLAIIPNS